MECGKEIWCRRNIFLQRIYISVRSCVRCPDNLTVLSVSYWGQARVCSFASTVFFSDKRASSGDSPEWYVWCAVRARCCTDVDNSIC